MNEWELEELGKVSRIMIVKMPEQDRNIGFITLNIALQAGYLLSK